MNPQAYKQAALEAFRYLRDEYGYEHVATDVHAPECWITFRSSATAVTVHYEVGSSPWVELGELVRDGQRLVERRRTSLELLLRDRAPTEPTSTTTDDGDDLRRILREKARQLRAYADDILRGDFTAFARLRQLAEENLKQRNAAEP